MLSSGGAVLKNLRGEDAVGQEWKAETTFWDNNGKENGNYCII